MISAFMHSLLALIMSVVSRLIIDIYRNEIYLVLFRFYRGRLGML